MWRESVEGECGGGRTWFKVIMFGGYYLSHLSLERFNACLHFLQFCRGLLSCLLDTEQRTHTK